MRVNFPRWVEGGYRDAESARRQVQIAAWAIAAALAFDFAQEVREGTLWWQIALSGGVLSILVFSLYRCSRPAAWCLALLSGLALAGNLVYLGHARSWSEWVDFGLGLVTFPLLVVAVRAAHAYHRLSKPAAAPLPPGHSLIP